MYLLITLICLLLPFYIAKIDALFFSMRLNHLLGLISRCLLLSDVLHRVKGTKQPPVTIVADTDRFRKDALTCTGARMYSVTLF